jgi:hypothetical protein
MVQSNLLPEILDQKQLGPQREVNNLYEVHRQETDSLGLEYRYLFAQLGTSKAPVKKATNHLSLLVGYHHHVPFIYYL